METNFVSIAHPSLKAAIEAYQARLFSLPLANQSTQLEKRQILVRPFSFHGRHWLRVSLSPKKTLALSFLPLFLPQGLPSNSLNSMVFLSHKFLSHKASLSKKNNFN